MASPRMWNKTVSATDVVTNVIVGATATPFGPATIYAYNSSTTDAAYIAITNVGANTTVITATATDDGVSWLVAPGKEVAWNLGTQDSTEKFSIGVIMASGKTATVYLSAIQAQ